MHPLFEIGGRCDKILRILRLEQQHHIFHFVMIQQIRSHCQFVAQFAAIPGQVVKAGVQIVIERIGRQRRHLGAADDIRIIVLVMLFQIGDLGHARVLGNIVGIPIHQSVSEHPEGVHRHIEQGK